MHEILFPSPFGTPPSPELVARARLVPVPEGFTGRAGVLVFEDEAGMHAEHAFEPVSRALCGAGPGCRGTRCPSARSSTDAA